MGCSGDDDSPTLTAVLSPSASATQTPAEAPSSTPTASPSPTPTLEATQSPLRPVFTSVDPGQPISQIGAYLYEPSTNNLWFIGSGGLWSPDSTAMARGSCCIGDGGGVSILELPSGQLRQIPIAGDSIALAWSPDSQRLAVVGASPGVTNPNSERSVYVVERDGSNVRKIDVSGVADQGYVDEVRWLDEMTVVFVQRSGNDPSKPVYTYTRVDLSTGVASRLQPADPLLRGDPRLLFGEASPDGSLVAYDDDGLYVWSSVTGRASLVDVAGYGASWSPDGTKLLFASNREGEGVPFWRLYDVASQTTTDLPDVGLWAQWTGDGRLVHDGWRCPTLGQRGISGAQDVTVTDPISGGSEVLTNTPDVAEYEARVSPSSPQLAYTVGGFPGSVELLDLTTEVTTNIVTASTAGQMEPFHVHRGSWSPDGRYLAFSYGFAHGICD